MSYAKLTSAWLAGALPLARGRDSLPDDDNWQSPQPLKPARPRLGWAGMGWDGMDPPL